MSLVIRTPALLLTQTGETASRMDACAKEVVPFPDICSVVVSWWNCVTGATPWVGSPSQQRTKNKEPFLFSLSMIV